MFVKSKEKNENDISNPKQLEGLNQENLTNQYSQFCELKPNETTFEYVEETSLLISTENTNQIPRSFHKQFNQLRKRLKANDSRKTSVDSLLKKCKSKCVRALHEGIKSCLNLLVGRLPQQFVTNIKIDFNKKILRKTIEQIYDEYNLLPKTEEILKQNLLKKGKYNLYLELSSSTFQTVCEKYLESNLYLEDLKYVSSKDGVDISLLYDFIAKNMCEYYLFSKGNRKLKMKTRRKAVFSVHREDQ